MGQALYRKYRSRSFGELIGQEHIAAALDQALKTKSLSHAYLFSGPRGTGKTSAARILAYAANGVDYGDNSVAMDIIEIDAASNTSVEDVRDLREKIFTAPSRGKYKVYIIDEVHMLSRAAFNALLKTLEEPPAHVIFILATTEAHKLPATIISRTQRFHFRLVDPGKVTEHLKTIAKSDKIKISPAALEIIAAHGQGSFRDSISLLDQARNLKPGGTVEAEDILDLLGQASGENLAEIESALARHNANRLLAALSAAANQGVDAASIAKQLSARWREQLVNGEPALPAQTSLQLLADLINIPASKEPGALLEIILLKQALKDAPAGANTASQTQKTSELKAPEPVKKPAAASKTPAEPESDPAPDMAGQTEPEIPGAPTGSSAATATGEKPNWPDILDVIKTDHSTLYGTARMARADWQDDKLVLYFRFPFHQKIFNQKSNQQVFIDAAKKLNNIDITIECLVDPNQEPVPIEEPPEPPAEQPLTGLDTITNIFGGGELLES